MKTFKSLSIDELKQYLKDAGLPAFRCNQLLDWVYVKNVNSYESMTNLPKQMRAQLTEELPLFETRYVDKQVSCDGSRKYIFEFSDGIVAETVGMPSEDGRLSVCISSQAGCAMRCQFCATGRNGLKRNLEPGELVDQIIGVQNDFGKRVTNVVVMGQGEPFANYDSVLAALRIINHSKLLNIGARHITVSTCGLIPGIQRFATEPEQFTLAISLHAAIQSVRDDLMPAVSKYQLPELRRTLIDYTEKTGRRFSFEYALMKGVNDSNDDLHALIEYCKGLLCHVNLIPLNEIDDSDFKPSGKAALSHWCSELEKKGIAATVRHSRGSDIDGACGQLASKLRM